MLLLMRRIGEALRINEDLVITIQAVQNDEVTFHLISSSSIEDSRIRLQEED